MTTLSPSPRELVERLSDDEKVAIDLILQAGDSSETDQRFIALIPSDGRRGYLKTLAGQLRALGLTALECSMPVSESAELDAQCAGWEQSRKRYEKESAEYAALRQREIDEQRSREAALPPVARRALERRRRREQRRNRR